MLSDPNDKMHDADTAFRNCYAPLLGAGSLLIFVLHGKDYLPQHKLPFDAPFSIELAMKGMVGFALSYVCAPTLAYVLISSIYGKLAGVRFDKNQLQVFVMFNLSVLMVCDIISALIPILSFLSVLKIFMIYILFEGIDNYMRIEQGRWAFAFISALSLYASPYVINHLLNMFEK